jgi:hypothetical protein
LAICSHTSLSRTGFSETTQASTSSRQNAGFSCGVNSLTICRDSPRAHTVNIFCSLPESFPSWLTPSMPFR